METKRIINGLLDRADRVADQSAGRIMKQAAKRLEELNQEQKWIPVTERLPSDDVPSTMYLCFWNGIIRVCKYWRTRKCFELRGKVVKVTHWMPLPNPPKEVDHES